MNKEEMVQAAADWNEYKRLVLQELERLSKDVEELKDLTVKNQVNVAVLMVKASLFGALAGAIPGAVAIFVNLSF